MRYSANASIPSTGRKCSTTSSAAAMIIRYNTFFCFFVIICLNSINKSVVSFRMAHSHLPGSPTRLRLLFPYSRFFSKIPRVETYHFRAFFVRFLFLTTEKSRSRPLPSCRPLRPSPSLPFHRHHPQIPPSFSGS